jgi:hypothetical protein
MKRHSWPYHCRIVDQITIILYLTEHQAPLSQKKVDPKTEMVKRIAKMIKEQSKFKDKKLQMSNQRL